MAGTIQKPTAHTSFGAATATRYRKLPCFTWLEFTPRLGLGTTDETPAQGTGVTVGVSVGVGEAPGVYVGVKVGVGVGGPEVRVGVPVGGVPVGVKLGVGVGWPNVRVGVK